MDSDHKTMLTIGSNGDAGCNVSLAAANSISIISTVSLLILCHNNELANEIGPHGSAILQCVNLLLARTRWQEVISESTILTCGSDAVGK